MTHPHARLTDVVLAVFHVNGRLIEWGDRFAAPYALTSARWQMLGALALGTQPLSAPQIAASMGVTRQGAQKQINLLLQDGLLEKLPNPAHARSPLYQLSAAGAATYQQVAAEWRQHATRAATRFTPDALETALAVLQALADLHAPGGEAEEEAVSHED